MFVHFQWEQKRKLAVIIVPAWSVKMVQQLTILLYCVVLTSM